jgi:hypothetical protein
LKPQLITPANETFTNDLYPFFTWHSVDTNAWYQLHISSDPAFSTIWGGGLGPDTTQQVGLIGGRWYWRVRAYSGGDSSDWSEVRALNVDTTYPYPPVLKGPPDNQLVNAAPGLSWNWTPGLMQCRVQVSADTNFTLLEADTTVPDSFYSAASLVDGKYFWRVQSRDSAGNWSTFGETRRFRQDTNPPYITWTYPVDGALVFQPDDTIKIAFSEPVQPGYFYYSISPSPGGVSGTSNPACDTFKLWSNGFSLATVCTLTVTGAQDSAGNALTAGPVPNPFIFTIATDTANPVITHLPGTSAVNPGYDLAVEAVISDAGGVYAYLHYRVGGQGAFTQLTMNIQPFDTFRVNIPGADVTERGLSYYIRADDGLGNQSLSPAGAPAVRHQRAVAVGTAAMPSGIPAGSYRMISAPFQSGGSPWRPYEFEDDFGAYDDTVWRLFRWQSGAYAEFNAAEDITPGRAYWLIAKNGGSIDLASAVSVPDSARYIPLAQGWNMVGSPFPYAVNLADAQVFDGGGNSYGFLDPANTLTEQRMVAYDGGGYSNVTQFLSWGGYWIKSLVPNATLLVQAVAAYKAAGAKQEEGWRLALSAAVNGYHDRENAAGIAPRGAKANASEPPVMGPHVSLAFLNDGKRLAEDVRPDIADGQSWRFTVSTDQPGTVELSFVEQGVNGGWTYAVYDISAGQKVTSPGSYCFQSPAGGGTREFALLAGSPEYIESEAGRAGLLPVTTLLEQNCPNPFGASTVISYQLAAPGPVTVSVYNVLGQRVRTLIRSEQPAGRYQLAWNGADDRGARLSSGVYLLRLEAAGISSARKITLLR